MSEPMISLEDLFALYDVIKVEQGGIDRTWPVTKAVLQWLADQGYFAQQELSMRSFGISPAIYPPPPTMADMVHEVVARFGAQTGIPAGPQASSGKPDAKAAGDLNAVADRPECEVKAPMGAEGVTLPVEAPATPVAGGVALSARWTPEEDEQAIAMRQAGHSASMIAAALGRPEQGTAFRLSKVLKDRIEAARAKGAATPAPELVADPEPSPEAEPDPFAAEPEPDIAPAPVHSAPPFDPSRPAWWREANANLNALGYRKPWTAQLDLDLATKALSDQMSVAEVALDMGMDSRAVKDRCQALKSCMPSRSMHISELVEILRARAAETSLKAAE